MIISGRSGRTFFALKIDREGSILSEKAQNFAPLIVCVFKRDELFLADFYQKKEKMIISGRTGATSSPAGTKK